MIKWLDKLLKMMLKEEQNINDKIEELWEVDLENIKSMKKYSKTSTEQRMKLNDNLTKELIDLRFAIRDIKNLVYCEKRKIN